MKCPTCNKAFVPRAVNQKFCSRKCERAATHQRYINRDTPNPPQGVMPIDEFICKNCGKVVFIYDRTDQRATYCSGKCAAAYAKKRAALKNEKVRGNLDISGGMSFCIV